MTSRWTEVREILGQALDLKPEERGSFLDSACAGDASLRREIETFINASEQTVDLPEPIAMRGAAEMTAGLSSLVGVEGRRIGRYEIRRVIGAGGMGVVYEAVQDRPRRPVALKVMKQGLASRSALRRFEYEAQLLGRLRHPGIAQVYEAGTHTEPETGATVPFFAMEYVAGARTLTEFARELKLGTRDRLALLVKVCEAVHHGHTKGVIHRDIKPANILVDAMGQPKIIDFGVARATDSDVAATMQTDVGQMVGTLQYMSPEQCRADPGDIDTRCDVYALGAVLYELLTGRPALDLSGVPVYEAARLIREQPVTRLSTLDRSLRGDVETIALKALEKDRERRYASAMELAEDVQRYLASEPIRARPPTITYQLRMFTRRNRGLVAMFAAAFVLLAGGLVGLTYMLSMVSAARTRAQTEADSAKAVSGFLREILVMPSPFVTPGEKRTVEDALNVAAQRISAAKMGPEAEATVRATIGSTYRGLGLFDRAEEQLRTAAEIRRRTLGSTDPLTLAAQCELAGVLTSRGRTDEAITLLRDAMSAQERSGDRESDTANRATSELAWTMYSRGNHVEAERLFRLVNEYNMRVAGPDSASSIKSRATLAMALVDVGREAEARPLIEESVSIAERVLPQAHPDLCYTLSIRGYVNRAQERYTEAIADYRRAVDLAETSMGADHPYRLFWSNAMAWAMLDSGDAAGARPVFEAVLAGRLSRLGPTHPDTLDTRVGVARCVLAAGDRAAAERALLEVHEAADQQGAAAASAKRTAGNTLSEMYLADGDAAKAARFKSPLEAPRRK